MSFSPLFYDLIIFGFLTVDFCVLLVFVIQFFRAGKKIMTPIPIACFLFTILAGGIIFYGSFIEPKAIAVTSVRLAEPLLERLGNIRIALVSDFHVGPYKKADFVAMAVEKINAEAPDLILLAGDFLYGEEIHPEYLEPLKNLRAPLGKFAVLGNHDYEEDFEDEPNFDENNERIIAVQKMLRETGITVLKNESVVIQNFVLGGVDEVWSGRADVEKTFRNTPKNLPKILLVHNPDIIAATLKYNVDAVFAAHTHGGQIRLPLWGPVPQLPTKLGRKYDQGLFEFAGKDGGKVQLLITRGLGETGPRARLFAHPEIMVIR